MFLKGRRDLPIRITRRMRTAAVARAEAEKKITEADDRIKASADHEQQMAQNRVKQVDEYVRLVQTRTRAIKLLDMVARGEEGALRMVDDFLDELRAGGERC
jgi:hypothetical protein